MAQATEDRPLVITEGARSGPYLGWEALGKVARQLAIQGATERPLQYEAYRDPGEIGGEQIKRRNGYGKGCGDDH